ncbi:hypothetical protein NOK12_32650 [Nocardioides sp. OK12]|nr:hypothetical protein NOK12_32650 [Nocardioides sp. OK12]
MFSFAGRLCSVDPAWSEGVSPAAAQVVPVRGRTVGVALRLAPPTHDAGPAGTGFGVDMRHQSTSSDRPTVRAGRDQGQTGALYLWSSPANLWTTSCWCPARGDRFDALGDPLGVRSDLGESPGPVRRAGSEKRF